MYVHGTFTSQPWETVMSILQWFGKFFLQENTGKVKLFRRFIGPLNPLSDRVEGSRFVNPLLEVSPTFYENQQVFSSLDRWAYHPTHGWPITISQILSNVFLCSVKLISTDVGCTAVFQRWCPTDLYDYISLMMPHIHPIQLIYLSHFNVSNVNHSWERWWAWMKWSLNKHLPSA